MVTFKKSSAPYQRGRKSTLGIMIELAIALGIVWIAAVVTTFIKLGSSYGVRSILLMVVAVAVTAVCDVLTTVLRNPKDKELGGKIVHDLIHNYSWITAMIFTLLCPVWTRYYVVIVGSIFSTMIVKNVFGGFGNNIFNPAAFGRIFIQLCFDLSVPAAITAGVDPTTGATLTGAFNSTQGWLGTLPFEGFKVTDILLGNYFGTMGEPFTLLLLVIGIVLAVRNVITWRAPVFYVGTVAVTSLVIGLVLGFDNPFLYTLYQLSLGGLMFGAVFMITDPVTTPSSPVGNCFVGVIAGLLTLLIRIWTPSAEGVVYSIAIVNLITSTVDRLVKGKSNDRIAVKYVVTFGTLAATIALVTTCAWVKNGGKEIYDINGYTVTEYNEIANEINFDFVGEKNYTYAPYKKDAKAADTDNILFEKEGFDVAYSLVDSSSKEVGAVYRVTSGKTIVIDNGYGEQKKTCSMYVAFTIEKMSLEAVNFITVPYVGGYQDKVQNGIQDYLSENDDILTASPSDVISGATYSAKGIQDLLVKANALFVSQYGA